MNSPEVHVYFGRGRNEREMEKGWIGDITEPTAPIPAPRWMGVASFTTGTSDAQRKGKGGG
jgi:hypothetical protein